MLCYNSENLKRNNINAGLILPNFTVASPYKPAGDQPNAIDTLSQSIEAGNQYQTLLGVTGSGKTYTMAKVIEKIIAQVESLLA